MIISRLLNQEQNVVYSLTSSVFFCSNLSVAEAGILGGCGSGRGVEAMSDSLSQASSSCGCGMGRLVSLVGFTIGSTCKKLSKVLDGYG